MRKLTNTIRLAALLAALPLAGTAAAQDAGHLRLEVRYAAYGTVSSDPAWATALDSLVSGGVRIDSVRIAATTSPDGPSADNDALSGQRALSLKEEVLRRLGSSFPLEALGLGEDWEAVEEFVSTTDDATVASHRAEMLRTMRSVVDPDRRLWLCRGIGEGRPWEVVAWATYPATRCAVVDVWFTESPKEDRPEDAAIMATGRTAAVPSDNIMGAGNPLPLALSSSVISGAFFPVFDLDAIKDSIARVASPEAPKKAFALSSPSKAEGFIQNDVTSLSEMPRDDAAAPRTAAAPQGAVRPGEETVTPGAGDPARESAPEAPASPAGRDWRWQLRTNTLLPLLNAGVGVTTGPKGRFTIGADVYYPWLRLVENDSWCVEALAASVEAGWTFRDGTDPARRGTGLGVQIGAAAGYYDLGVRYKGVQGEGAAAWVGASWTWAVARGRLRLGIHAAGGVLLTQYRVYEVYEGAAWREGDFSHNMVYYGPLKAELRLGIPLWVDKKMEVKR